MTRMRQIIGDKTEKIPAAIRSIRVILVPLTITLM
jgi:hypothetical protein